MVDLKDRHGLSWADWANQFEDLHQKMRKDIEGFEGYGQRPIMATTGEDSWQQYWMDGYSPAEALAEDMSYWE
jgi:hypothetical protein